MSISAHTRTFIHTKYVFMRTYIKRVNWATELQLYLPPIIGQVLVLSNNQSSFSYKVVCSTTMVPGIFYDQCCSCHSNAGTNEENRADEIHICSIQRFLLSPALYLFLCTVCMSAMFRCLVVVWDGDSNLYVAARMLICSMSQSGAGLR